MTLPKFTRTDDSQFNILDEEGISHDGVGGFIGNYLNLCGCGRPEDVLDTVLGLLEAFDARSAAWKADDKAADDRAYKQIEKLAPTDGEHAGLGWLMLYWLDHKGLTEHGGSVGGSWLTADGKEMLALLREWREKERPVDDESSDLPTSTPSKEPTE